MHLMSECASRASACERGRAEGTAHRRLPSLPRPAVPGRMYTYARHAKADKDRRRIILFFSKGGGQVLAELQNNRIQVKPDDFNDEGFG